MPTEFSIALERRVAAEDAEKANTHLFVLIVPLLLCLISIAPCLAVPDVAAAVKRYGNVRMIR